MSLRLATDVARSSLTANSERAAIVSRNVANVGNPDVSRKNGNLITTDIGGVRVENISRVTNTALQQSLQRSVSSESYSSSVLSGIDQMKYIVGDNLDGQSVPALLGKLRDSLQEYAAAPSNSTLGTTAVAAAQDVVRALNDGSAAIQAAREFADAHMAEDVAELNAALVTFEENEAEIKTGTVTGADITDQLDKRDKLLSQISEIVEIRTIVRQDNSMVIFTGNGATLFETVARDVSFSATPVFTASQTGNQVFVDGVAITGTANDPPGSLAGYASVRDDVAVTFQSQIDEVARGLIATFAESDQSAVPALPDRAGLFTYSGAPGIPAGATIVTGLAADISVNSSVVPSLGGDVARLRDGEISDPGNPAYLYNTSGGASFADRLFELADGLSATTTFDAASGIKSTASVLEFASNSAAWFEQGRKTANVNAEIQAAGRTRFQASISSETGVNLDAEMTTMLDLERSYAATSRLLGIIDSMYESLFAAAR